MIKTDVRWPRGNVRAGSQFEATPLDGDGFDFRQTYGTIIRRANHYIILLRFRTNTDAYSSSYLAT